MAEPLRDPRSDDLGDWIKASGADEKVQEVYVMLKRFMEAPERKTWLEQRKKNWDAVGKNEMWTQDELNELQETGQLPIIANECNKGVQAAAAIVTDAKPEVIVLPRKGGSIYLSELIKRGHDLVWEQNYGNDILYAAVEECKISGLGAIDSWFNKNKGVFGKICMDALKPDGIYFDPNAERPDYSDTDLIKAYPRDKKYIQDRYGDRVKEEDISFGQELLTTSDMEGTKSTGLTAGDSYTMEDAKAIPGDVRQPKNIWEIEALLIKTVDEFVCTMQFADGGRPLPFRWRGKDQKKVEEEIRGNYPDQSITAIEMVPTKVETRLHRIIVGKKLIEETENPYGEDPDGDPILKLNLLPHSSSGNAYPTCPTTYALPLNREKNKRRSQHIYMTSILNNPPLMEPAGKTKWEGKPGTPGSKVKVEGNAAFPPAYLVGQTNTMDFQYHDIQLSKDIQDQFDTPDVVRGKMPVNKKDASGRAIAYLQDLAGVMSKPFIRKLEAFIARIGRANIAIMLANWKRHQWEALLDETDWSEWMPEDEKAEMEAQQAQAMPQPGMTAPGQMQGQMPPPQQPPGPVKPDGEAIKARWMEALDKVAPMNGEANIDIMDFEIKVAAGSSMPSNRMARQAEALEQVKMGLLDPETYWEQVDSTIKDKVVPRLKAREQAMMQAAAQGIKPKGGPSAANRQG